MTRIVGYAGFPSSYMNPVSLSSMFRDVGVSSGWLLPIIVIAGLALLYIATMRNDSRPYDQLRALYCHFVQLIGILLMTAGALPAVYAVFAPQPLATATYIGLLLVFAIGGLLFLWHDARLKEIDPVARAMADAIFYHGWKLTGLLVTVFTGLSFVLRSMLAEAQTPGWYTVHLTMLLYGLTICMFTIHRGRPVMVKKPGLFTRPKLIATSKKPATRKR